MGYIVGAALLILALVVAFSIIKIVPQGREFTVATRLHRMVGERYAAAGSGEDYEPGGLADQRRVDLYEVHLAAEGAHIRPTGGQRRNGPDDGFAWLLASDCEITQRKPYARVRCPACRARRYATIDALGQVECTVCGHGWFMPLDYRSRP